MKTRARHRADLDAPILILAVGNLLMGDEGVGVHALRALECEVPVPGARLLDGGVAGRESAR